MAIVHLEWADDDRAIALADRGLHRRASSLRSRMITLGFPGDRAHHRRSRDCWRPPATLYFWRPLGVALCVDARRGPACAARTPDDGLARGASALRRGLGDRHRGVLCRSARSAGRSSGRPSRPTRHGRVHRRACRRRGRRGSSLRRLLNVAFELAAWSSIILLLSIASQAGDLFEVLRSNAGSAPRIPAASSPATAGSWTGSTA